MLRIVSATVIGTGSISVIIIISTIEVWIDGNWNTEKEEINTAEGGAKPPAVVTLRKLNPEELMGLGQGHVAREQQNQDFNSDVTPSPVSC